MMTPLPELQQQAVSVTRTFTLRSPQGSLPSQSDHAQALDCLLQQRAPPELLKQTCKGGKGISKIHRSDCGNLSSLGCLGGSRPQESMIAMAGGSALSWGGFWQVL